MTLAGFKRTISIELYTMRGICGGDKLKWNQNGELGIFQLHYLQV